MRLSADSFPSAQRPLRVVAIAASVGGIQALSDLLSSLPADFPAAVLVVQHVSPDHRSYLASILSERTPLPVRTAKHGEPLRGGVVYVCPPDRHLEIEPDERLIVTARPKLNFTRPSADLLFQSLARYVGSRGIGVVLTGRGHDGAAGVAEVRRQGGVVIVQEPSTCVSPIMPQAVLSTCGADFILPPRKIAAALVSLVMAPGLSAVLFGIPVIPSTA